MPETIIPGPAGRLEARYRAAEKRTAPVALILHPSPILGGTMKTKIVHHLYENFSNNGFGVLRFNFRGVERSSGDKGAGDNEVADAAAVLDWLQIQVPEASEIWVAGFSFGSWVAMQLLMRRPEVTRFVVLAPLADKTDFSFLQPCPSSGLIIQGEKDRFSSPTSVENWVRELSQQPDIEIEYRSISGADHFFSNHIEKMSQIVENYIQSVYKPNEVKKKSPTRGRKKKAQASAA
ncbi:MAG: alpha/beta hydrolase [Alphaproteobacteria bacterium]